MKLTNKNHSEATQYKSKVSITFLAFAIISMCSIGCRQQQITCDNTNTLFHQIYTNAASASGNTDRDYMDDTIHEYDFTVSSNEVICSVGYKAYVAQPYKIEIIDNTTASTLFSNTNTFNTSSTSYVSVPNISVIPGHSYTVRRTFAGIGALLDLQGKIVMSATPGIFMTFPKTVGAMTITGSRFYDPHFFAIALPNVGIPFIDIVFQ